MTRLAANLTMLFTEVPFMERFAAAKSAGFEAVEYLFPYAFDKTELAKALAGFLFDDDDALLVIDGHRQ